MAEKERDLRGFLQWVDDFSMQDDGVEAYTAITKLREISAVVAMEEEGWEDEVRAIIRS